MTFEIYDINGNAVQADNILSYELVSETSAACDGLQIKFICAESCVKIGKIIARRGGEKIFCGFADKQKSVLTDGGYIYVYARSGGSVLVDNEAIPCEYRHPTSKQLWLCCAEPFGIKFALPQVASQGSYAVQKGKSCYAAINDFMLYTHGTAIYVSQENELKAFEKNGDIIAADENDVISAAVVYDRSAVISRVDYKINPADKYIYHLESKLAAENSVLRRRLVNLSALPPWQRDKKCVQMLKNSEKSFCTVQVVFSRDADFKLAGRVTLPFKGFEGQAFTVMKTIRAKNAGGETTTVHFIPETEEGYLNYVAEQKL